MEPLPAEVYTAAQVRAMDRHAIDVAGISGYELMTRAGGAALACLQRAWPAARRLAVACGAGNNAGDGYVLARLARQAGLETEVCAVGDTAALRGDAARAQADFAAAGGRSRAFDIAAVEGCDLVVDALLGTGLDRPLSGPMLAAVRALNGSGLPVLALDLPTGLDADTGRVLGAAVRASRTISFVGLKAGLFLGEAPERVGVLEFDSLGVPASAASEQTPLLRRLDEVLLAAALPRRRRLAHKGDHGRVLVLGGGAMAGAARLAGEAALRAGAGLVSVATRRESVAAIVAGRPELIAQAVSSAVSLRPLLGACDVVAAGPGLGQDRWAARLLAAALKAAAPKLLDADALSLLARRPFRRDDWILTPHPGEAARLLGTRVAEVQDDRLAAARAIAGRYGGVCVLKGAGTLVCGAEGVAWLCDRGNPGMATAGTGDVLTGVIAAFLAQGASAELAAAAGVLAHAMAGDRAAAALGERGLIASDLIAALPGVVNPPWS